MRGASGTSGIAAPCAAVSDRCGSSPRHLKRYFPGILAHCRRAQGSNLIDCLNNKINVIKRMAYGVRDDTYFFLKIRAAFPGIR